MKKRYALASVFTAVVALAAWAVPAGAEPTHQAAGGAKATVLGNVRLDPSDPTAAYVTGQYLCPKDQVPHLWVSVKQLNSGRPNNDLKGDGSGFRGVADAWSQSHPDPGTLTCDGKYHTVTIRTDQTEPLTDEEGHPLGGNVGFGSLKPGQVYAQFCLTSSDFSWFAWDMRFSVAR
jgi:hypothetical protein